MGWARSNLIFETLSEPPKPGTPLESLMLLVWRMRQDVRQYETRALVHAILAAAPEADEKTHKNMQDAWKDYTEELFPFQRGQRRNENEAAVDYLKREVARGPLKVTPLQTLGTRAKSRLKRRHAEVSESRRKVRLPRRRRR